MYCGTCGKELPDGAKFCNGCGAAQSEAVTTEPKTTPVVNQTTLPTAEKPEKKKKKVNKKLLAVVAVVLMVAVVAAIVIPIFFPSKEDTGKETIYVCVNEVYYNFKGDPVRNIAYKYDEAGNLLSSKADIAEDTVLFDEELQVYTYVNGICDGTVDQIDEYSYNEFGYLIQQTSNHNGNFTVEYTYNEDNDFVSYVQKFEPSGEDDAETAAPASYECKYSNDGYLVSITEITDDGNYPVYVFEYDEDGRLKAEEFYFDDCTYRNVFSYDDGRLCRIDHYKGLSYYPEIEDMEFTIQSSMEYEFDEEGQLNKEIHLDENGDLFRRRIFEYDDDGFLEELSIYSSNVSLDEIQYTCDDYGNIIEEEYESGKRIEREYEALEVTAKQAAHFRRKEGYRLNDYNEFIYNSCWYYYLIPNPLWEKSK